MTEQIKTSDVYFPDRINTKNEDEFFEYVFNRLMMTVKRSINQSTPHRAQPPFKTLTDDEILAKYKFTNVFRVLDPGTIYVINEIGKEHHITELPLLKYNDPHKQEQWFKDCANLLFRLIVYRVFNKKETYEAFFNHIGKYFCVRTSGLHDWDNISDIITQKVKTPFTGAFTVSGYQQFKGKNKVDSVCKMLLEEALYSVYEITMNLSDMLFSNKYSDYQLSEALFEKLKGINGIGTFLAYQIAVDFGYFYPSMFDEDIFAVGGNGCIKGLSYIFPAEKDNQDTSKSPQINKIFRDIPTQIRHMKYLVKRQNAHFTIYCQRRLEKLKATVKKDGTLTEALEIEMDDLKLWLHIIEKENYNTGYAIENLLRYIIITSPNPKESAIGTKAYTRRPWVDANIPERLQRKRLNLMAIENCLCEYSKWKRAKDGGTKPRQKYRYRASQEKRVTLLDELSDQKCGECYYCKNIDNNKEKD